jgi:hypothetical protein
MCLPLAAAAAVAGAAVSAGGQIMQGMQAKAQGKYEAQVAEMNRGLEVDAAHQSILAGQDERRDFWRKVSSLKGQQVAAMAANGIDLGFGAGERVQSDTQMLANDDAKNLYRSIEERTKGHIINAANYRESGKASVARGKAAFTSSLFGAAGSLLGGVSQAAGMRAKMGTP